MNETYQDIRNKTIKWCQGLLDNDIYTQKQYNECVRGFVDMGVGEMPPDMDLPSTSNEHTYSLYNRDSDYTTKNIVSSSSGKVMLKTINGMFLTSKPDGEIYISNGKDLTNQKEVEWKINFQKDDTYTILSTYGNFIGITRDKRLTTNNQNLEEISQVTNNTPVADREALDPSTIWKINKIDNRVTLESMKYPGEKITNSTPISLSKGQSESQFWLVVNVPNQNESIIPLFDPIQIHEAKNIILTDLSNLLKDKFILLVEIKFLFGIGRNLEDEYCKIVKRMKKNIDKLNDYFNKRVNREIPRTRIPNDSNPIYTRLINTTFNKRALKRFLNDFYIPSRNSNGRPISRLDLREYSIFNVGNDTLRPNFPIKSVSPICRTQIGRTYPPLKILLEEKQNHAVKLNQKLESTIIKFREVDSRLEKKFQELDEFINELNQTIDTDKNNIINNNILIERKGNKINRLEQQNRKLDVKNQTLVRRQGLSEINSEKIQKEIKINIYKIYTIYGMILITISLIIYILYSFIPN